MNFMDEKDYIMRVIKEMVRVLFSLLFGKKYASVDQEHENKYEVAAAALFYQYLSEKEDDFFKQHDYSKEEVLDGMKQLLKKSGYSDLTNIIEY